MSPDPRPAAPDVPAEEPPTVCMLCYHDYAESATCTRSDCEVKRWLRELRDAATSYRPFPKDTARMLAETLPLLIQRAHDAEAREAELRTAYDAGLQKNAAQFRQIVTLEGQLRDAKQRIAVLQQERKALIEGKVWQEEDAGGDPTGQWSWCGRITSSTAHPERVQPPAASANEALAAYHAVLALLSEDQ